MTKKQKLTLSADQRALMGAALLNMVRETESAYAEFGDMTPEEWQAMKRRARRTGRGPSDVSDEELLAKFHDYGAWSPGGRKLKKRERYERIARLFLMHWTTVRDRLIKLQRQPA
ncbi:MAG TPA: hypothetical protein VFT29_00320 [Gemmatimonadaceae bacterium]|nr:hypothetical protein [Gemmatimonadaceae bacterium]